jgi:hypothetical protein
LYGLKIEDINPLILPLINDWMARVDRDFKDLYISKKPEKV